jgi:hypothetical protein
VEGATIRVAGWQILWPIEDRFAGQESMALVRMESEAELGRLDHQDLTNRIDRSIVGN